MLIFIFEFADNVSKYLNLNVFSLALLDCSPTSSLNNTQQHGWCGKFSQVNSRVGTLNKATVSVHYR